MIAFDVSVTFSESSRTKRAIQKQNRHAIRRSFHPKYSTIGEHQKQEPDFLQPDFTYRFGSILQQFVQQSVAYPFLFIRGIYCQPFSLR